MLLVIDCPNNRKIKVYKSGIYIEEGDNERKIDKLNELTYDEKERLYMATEIIKHKFNDRSLNGNENEAR